MRHSHIRLPKAIQNYPPASLPLFGPNLPVCPHYSSARATCHAILSVRSIIHSVKRHPSAGATCHAMLCLSFSACGVGFLLTQPAMLLHSQACNVVLLLTQTAMPLVYLILCVHTHTLTLTPPPAPRPPTTTHTILKGSQGEHGTEYL